MQLAALKRGHLSTFIVKRKLFQSQAHNDELRLEISVGAHKIIELITTRLFYANLSQNGSQQRFNLNNSETDHLLDEEKTFSPLN